MCLCGVFPPDVRMRCGPRGNRRAHASARRPLPRGPHGGRHDSKEHTEKRRRGVRPSDHSQRVRVSQTTTGIWIGAGTTPWRAGKRRVTTSAEKHIVVCAYPRRSIPLRSIEEEWSMEILSTTCAGRDVEQTPVTACVVMRTSHGQCHTACRTPMTTPQTNPPQFLRVHSRCFPSTWWTTDSGLVSVRPFRVGRALVMDHASAHCLQ